MKNDGSRQLQDKQDLVLIRDDEFIIPKCLDEHIASVRLSTPNNYFNDGYEIQISAFFGTERVSIYVEDVELSTIISIQKAEVVIQELRSQISVLNVQVEQRDTEHKRTQVNEFSDSKMRTGKLGGEGSASLSKASSSISGSLERSRKKQSVSKEIIEDTKTLRSWDLIADRIVRIYEGGQDLDGVLLPNVALWKAFPDTTSSVTGVFARIRVRENWITFRETRHERGKGRLALTLEKVFSSENQRKKDLFEVLIRHLSLKGLQEPDERRQATLAVTAIVVRPEKEALYSVPPEDRASIRLPSEPLISFLEADDGEEETVLVALGVPRQSIPAPANNDKFDIAGKIRDDFLPRGSPIDAVNALNELKSFSEDSAGYFKSKYGDNTIRDLSALGVIQKKIDKKLSMTDLYKDPVRAIRHAASNSQSMKVTRLVLLANSNASVLDIADAVALKIGRNWSNAATKKRRGNALRRWALWLEDYLIDTKLNPDAEVLVKYAKSTRRRIGGHTKVTPEKAEEAKRLLASGLSKAKVAKALNVTVVTLRKILETYKNEI